MERLTYGQRKNAPRRVPRSSFTLVTKAAADVSASVGGCACSANRLKGLPLLSLTRNTRMGVKVEMPSPLMDQKREPAAARKVNRPSSQHAGGEVQGACRCRPHQAHTIHVPRASPAAVPPGGFNGRCQPLLSHRPNLPQPRLGVQPQVVQRYHQVRGPEVRRQVRLHQLSQRPHLQLRRLLGSSLHCRRSSGGTSRCGGRTSGLVPSVC